MDNAKRIGRGANVRHFTTRMTVSVAVATVVVAATVMPARESTVSPAVRLAASSETCTRPDVPCALVLGGTTVPTPDDYYIEVVKNHFIAPTYPKEENIEYVAVTTPEQAWPLTGLGRLLFVAFGPPEIWGSGGAGRPDEPWWRLTGLFDLTFDQSVRRGVADLEDAMAKQPNDHLVIYGYSQGAMIANLEKRKLAEQYPAGTKAPGIPDIDFVLSGDPNLPNGGLAARFPGLYVPIIDLSFNGPAPTDTEFDTVEINRQYEGVSDFPLYPLNVISLLNAVLGVFYVHPYDLDVSLLPDPSTSPPIKSQHGDTTYYFFETPDLPLFGPLRTLGVPEPVIDVFEPFFREVVELGYDRSIPQWERTPARLIPKLNPVTVAGDLVDAIGEGVNNALALTGAPAPLSVPAPATADGDAAVEQIVSPSEVNVERESQPPQPPAVTENHRLASQGKVEQELSAILEQVEKSVSAVKSVVGKGRTTVRSAEGNNGSPPSTARPAPRTPLRDAIKDASSGVKKVVDKLSDSINKALRGDKHYDIKDGDEDAAS